LHPDGSTIAWIIVDSGEHVLDTIMADNTGGTEIIELQNVCSRRKRNANGL